MAIKDKFYTGTTVSRHLPVGERGFSQVVAQSGKFLLDAEVIQNQELLQNSNFLLQNNHIPSGWVRSQSRRDPYSDYSFAAPFSGDFVENAFVLNKMKVVVADCPPITVEYTNTTTDGENLIQLDAPPIFGGTAPDVKRTDFVFLEVFKVLIQPSPSATGEVEVASLPSALDTLTIDGIPLTAVAGVPGVDEFQIGVDEPTTAANIANAINDVANSFTGTVSASDDGAGVVTLTAVNPGTAGNSITLVSSVPAVLVVSGPTLSGGADTSNKPAQDKIYRHGNVDSPSATWLDDDLEDPTLGIETAQRIQVQYRIRVTGQSEAIDYKTEPDGFSNSAVLAQGSQSSPVANYPFIPADLSTTSLNSSAVAYDIEDPGLWIAGDGSSTAAADLGSVDGYVYAVPLCFVFRLNDDFDGGSGSGWDPVSNANGGIPTTHGGFVHPILGALGVQDSDRPDGGFVDAISQENLLDLRRFVVPAGIDLPSEVDYQLQSLLDGTLRTWAVDTSDKQDLGSGSGNISTTYLICNEIGRKAVHGGTGVVDGDTSRGVTVRSFDHLARRYGDQPVVEKVVFEFIPSYDQATYPGKYVVQDNVGFAGWHEDDVLHLDFDALTASTDGTYLPPGSYSGGAAEFIFEFAPPGTTITNVLSILHDDGNSGGTVSVDTQVKSIVGIGTPHLEITLDANSTSVDGGDPGNPTGPLLGTGAVDDGSQRKILLEVEITYPRENTTGEGSGVTDTPDITLSPDSTPYPQGPLLENNPSSRPPDMEDPLAPAFREGFREVKLEYIASDDGLGTPITEQVVSTDSTTIVLSRRPYGNASFPITVEDVPSSTSYTVDISSTEYGSSSRIVKLTSALPADNRLVEVTYFSQDPIPQSGGAGAGYQLSVYFQSVAPQTVGLSSLSTTTILPTNMTIEVLASSRHIWTGQVGSGGVERPYPYAAPLDQIPVNQGSSTFSGEWDFAATANISIDDFSATVGNLTLQPMILMDITENLTFSNPDKDSEFRLFFPDVDVNSYHPTSLAQNMSGVVSHKVWVPFIVRATEDTLAFRKNELLLMIISRWAELDKENTIRFVDSDNTTCASFFRTKSQLLTPKF